MPIHLSHIERIHIHSIGVNTAEAFTSMPNRPTRSMLLEVMTYARYGRGLNDANIMASNAMFHLAETTVVNTCLGGKMSKYAVKTTWLFWAWRLWQT